MSELIRSNKRRSAAMVAAFVVVWLVLGALIGLLADAPLVGAAVGAVIAAAIVAASYWSGDRITLRVSRARPVSAEEFPRLHNLVEGLCISGGVPAPAIHVIDDAAPNAFATGRGPNHASLVVTTGLLDQLDRVELEGVVAHELSHIRHYDILPSTLAVTIVGGLALTADLAIRTRWWNGGRVPRPGDPDDTNNPAALIGFGLLAASPLIGKLMQVSTRPDRETLADMNACSLTRYPPGLVSALEKLHADSTATHAASTSTAHLWFAQPMSGIADDGRLANVHRWFDTHPPLDERIALLREL